MKIHKAFLEEHYFCHSLWSEIHTFFVVKEEANQFPVLISGKWVSGRLRFAKISSATDDAEVVFETFKNEK